MSYDDPTTRYETPTTRYDTSTTSYNEKETRYNAPSTRYNDLKMRYGVDFQGFTIKGMYFKLKTVKKEALVLISKIKDVVFELMEDIHIYVC